MHENLLRKGKGERGEKERGTCAEGAATRFIARADPTEVPLEWGATGITGVGLKSHSSGSQRQTAERGGGGREKHMHIFSFIYLLCFSFYKNAVIKTTSVHY